MWSSRIFSRIVLDKISKYKDDFIDTTCETDTQIYNRINNSLRDNEALLAKYQKAIESVNDAYDLGAYTREEWIRRKDKWNTAIEGINPTLRARRQKASKNMVLSSNKHL